jgi:hypothetical protein
LQTAGGGYIEFGQGMTGGYLSFTVTPLWVGGRGGGTLAAGNVYGGGGGGSRIDSTVRAGGISIFGGNGGAGGGTSGTSGGAGVAPGGGGGGAAGADGGSGALGEVRIYSW